MKSITKSAMVLFSGFLMLLAIAGCSMPQLENSTPSNDNPKALAGTAAMSVSISIQDKAIATATVVNGSGNYQYTWTVDNSILSTNANTCNIAYWTFVRYSNGGSYSVAVSVKDLSNGKIAQNSTTVYYAGNGR